MTQIVAFPSKTAVDSIVADCHDSKHISSCRHGHLAVCEPCLILHCKYRFHAVQVSAREQAREIGLLALRKAAWSRQRDETLLAQRRRLAAELSNVQSPETAAAEYARPLSARSAGTHCIQAATCVL